MALITVSDITTYMDISFTNVQEDAAQFVIDGLQAELEAYLRRPVEQVSFTETYRVPDVGRGVVNNQYYYNYTLDRSLPRLYLLPGLRTIRLLFTLYLENSPVVSVDVGGHYGGVCFGGGNDYGSGCGARLCDERLWH